MDFTGFVADLIVTGGTMTFGIIYVFLSMWIITGRLWKDDQKIAHMFAMLIGGVLYSVVYPYLPRQGLKAHIVLLIIILLMSGIIRLAKE